MWWVCSSGAKSAGTLKRPQQLSSSLPQTHNQTCSEQIIRHSNRQWQAYTKIRHAVNRYQIHIQTYSDQKHKIRHTVNTNMQPYMQWQAYTKIRRKAWKGAQSKINALSLSYNYNGFEQFVWRQNKTRNELGSQQNQSKCQFQLLLLKHFIFWQFFLVF